MKNIRIDSDWTLFLDRDGVVNVRYHEGYIKSWAEFAFMPNAIERITALREVFKYIFVVTNQQGVGKGLMTEHDLQLIHLQMLLMLEEKNKTALSVINRVYFCPSLTAANDPNRKPEIGMALQAQRDFQGVDFQKSMMIGDTISDMQFGRKAGMVTVFFGKGEVAETESHWIDFTCKDWEEVRQLIQDLQKK
jgi:histidinol-phosphate phosphatase family protein